VAPSDSATALVLCFRPSVDRFHRIPNAPAGSHGKNSRWDHRAARILGDEALGRIWFPSRCKFLLLHRHGQPARGDPGAGRHTERVLVICLAPVGFLRCSDAWVRFGFLDPGSQSEAELKLDHVVLWDQFAAFVELRHKSNPKLILYADSDGQTGQMSGDPKVPPGLGPMENPHLVWSTMLRQKWEDLEVKDAFAIIDEVRSVKSPGEVARMREAAAVTAKGFWAGVNAIAPGKTQRQVEGAVLDECLQAGSTGPALFEAFLDYDNLDRRMQAGEMVRLDLGCDSQMYKGDFGRTIPVSGHFDEGQGETMELLNGAYLAGVSQMRPGATAKDVFKATTSYVQQHQTELKSATAKEAAANFLKQPNLPLHGLGVDMAEGVPKSFQAGNVLCYEPLLTAGNQAFFVEDTFLIVPTGHEILNPSLPYSAKDIERAMAKRGP
jgi:hypothetical protein